MDRHDLEPRQVATALYLGKITWKDAMAELRALGFEQAMCAKILLGIR